MSNQPPKPLFTVLDKITNAEPDTEKIALNEDWANHLIYCDITGWYIGAHGELILVDDTGASAYAPPDRFEVQWIDGTQPNNQPR